MSKKKVNFIGILSNTDSTILNLNLDHDFIVREASDNEGTILISELETLPYREVYNELIKYSCVNISEKKIYFIDNSFESDIEINEKGILTSFPMGIAKFSNELVNGYLNSVIRLIRLFKEGNICIPMHYYFIRHDNRLKSFIRQKTLSYIPPGPIYTIENSEISHLHKFIKSVKLPFNFPFLQLAFENFELSYQTNNINLSFLSLIISLETLFNPSEQELRYRISRNTAVLLGKDKDDSKLILSDIKKLYDKRSKIVHTGKPNAVNENDLLKLRYYVRESVKKINIINKNKDELLDILNICGFGVKIWTNSIKINGRSNLGPLNFL